MSASHSHFLMVHGYELHVREWGAGNAKTIILWHGFARTSSDFGPLARALAGRWRLLAPDTIGRGLSSWGRVPSDYTFASYAVLAQGIVDAFALQQFDWIGTSMGGALGLYLATGPMAGRIKRLVLNDIGPEVPQAARQRIATYAANPPVFATMLEVEAWLRIVYQPYGWISDDDWRRMAITSVRRMDDGRLTVHYDPRIVNQPTTTPDDYDQWLAWQALTRPSLILRGEDSDLLLADVAERMLLENPMTRLIDVPECGHAPALNVSGQIAPIRAFLDSTAFM